MKKRTFIMGLAALALAFGSAGVIGGVSLSANDSAIMTRAEEAVTTTTVTCGNAGWKIESASSNYTDSLSTLWSATTVGTTSFTNDKNTTWAQIGASKKPATSINIVGTLGNNDNVITSVSVKMGGFKDTAGTVTIKVDNVSVGTGSLSGSTDVAISSSGELSGNEISLSVTGIAKGVKIYSITYTTKPNPNPSVSIEDGSDITLKNGGTKDVALTIKNLPEGGSVSAETEDSSIATASVNNGTMTINGLAVGETTYTVTMKDSSGTEIASCTGKITVSASVTGVTISSDFKNNDTLKLGSTHELVAEVEPGAASQDVEWSVSDTDAASVSSSGVLTIKKKTGTDAIKVTATSAADSSFTAELSFYVTNELTIAELSTKDGTTIGNSIADGTEVVTKGTITTFEGKSAYIQSGSSGVMIYTSGDELDSFKIGDGVKVTGNVTIYYGLVEIKSPTVEADSTAKEDIAALELSKDLLTYKNTGILAAATKAVCLSSTVVATSTEKSLVSVGFKFAGSESTSAEFYVNVKKNYFSEVGGMFGDFEKGATYNIQGVFINYVAKTTLKVTPEVVIETSNCHYYNANIQDFIDAYIDGATGTTCKSKYEEATEALTLLTEAEQNVFKTASAYADAYEEYKYWGDHQNDSNAAKLVNGSDATNWTNLAVLGTAFLLAAAASVYLFLNKKKQDR